MTIELSMPRRSTDTVECFTALRGLVVKLSDGFDPDGKGLDTFFLLLVYVSRGNSKVSWCAGCKSACVPAKFQTRV